MQVLPLVPSALQGTGAELAALVASFSSPGLPVMSCEDVFLSDPLLPCGQRVPLYLSEPPQQVSALPALASPQRSPQGLGRDTCPSSLLR